MFFICSFTTCFYHLLYVSVSSALFNYLWSYLEHDSEEDDHDGRGDEVILGFDLLSVQQHHQSERHRPSQAAV